MANKTEMLALLPVGGRGQNGEDVEFWCVGSNERVNARHVV